LTKSVGESAKKLGWPICTVAVVGILSIAGIEVWAMEQGRDGIVLSTCVAAIVAIVAGLGGFKIGKIGKGNG
jgi:hypothetical protein